MIDLKKAFDSVSWRFICKVLFISILVRQFQIGLNFSKKAFQKNHVSCVTQADILSN